MSTTTMAAQGPEIVIGKAYAVAMRATDKARIAMSEAAKAVDQASFRKVSSDVELSVVEHAMHAESCYQAAAAHTRMLAELNNLPTTPTGAEVEQAEGYKQKAVEMMRAANEAAWLATVALLEV